MVKIKDQSDISATASKGQIEWGKRTIELKGAVTITSTAAGETQPTTIKCDSAVIRWSEKLEDGQTRIKVEGTQVSVESSRAK